MKFLKLMFFGCSMLLSTGAFAQWEQLGDYVAGEHGGDEFGAEVSMNAAGNRWIATSLGNSDNGYLTGHVRAFQWDGYAWSQMGQDLDGSDVNEHYGQAISMNAEGNVIALGNKENDEYQTNAGLVDVFEWDGQQWNLLGGHLYGLDDSQQAGYDVALSGSGHRLAIGYPTSSGEFLYAGMVRVLDWDGANWNLVGSAVQGYATSEILGTAVALNIEGTVLAVAASSTLFESENVGSVRIFDLVDNNWVLRGEPIYGELSGNTMAEDLKLTADGNRIAISASAFPSSSNIDGAGVVRVFDWTGTAWEQVGTHLEGQSEYELFGSDIELSDDGSLLCVGAALNDDFITNSGQVRCYEYDGNDWVEVSHFEGENNGDRLGLGIGMNASGTVVAAGVFSYDEPENSNGAVRVMATCPPNFVELSSCDTYELPSGAVVMESGLYADEFPDGSSCDDALNFNVTILQSSEVFLPVEDCHQYYNSDSSMVYTESGIYYEYYENSVGCDSVVVIDLLINSTYAEIEVFECDSFITPSGVALYTSGLYNDTIPNSFMCDSVITFNLSIGSSTHNFAISACEYYVLPSGMDTVFFSGVYQDTLLNSIGCDSLLTISLSILQSTTFIQDTIACGSYVSPAGNEYVVSDTYFDTIPNFAGCDSIITTHLTILDPSFSSLDTTVCFSFTGPGGTTWNESGTWYEVIPNAAGCDSTITVNLTVNEVNLEVNQADNLLTSNATEALFQWVDCENNMSELTGETNSTFEASENGSYAVMIEQAGCTALSECFDVISFGIRQMDGLTISYYPNPAHSTLTLKSSQTIGDIRIVGTAGNEVMALHTALDTIEIDLNGIDPGVYLIRLLNTQFRIIIQ
ncbi:MAG: T9SS type A sorting domain-containing protein [Flavobacteriales bacterium]|nr:T9SS type A sorting domain-containing protein [Flavobacteriales bacterium]